MSETSESTSITAPATTAPAKRTGIFDYPPNEKRALSAMVGASTAMFLYGDRPIIGAITGAVVGYEIPGLLNEKERMRSMSALLIAGGATASMHLLKKRPVTGFVLGGLLTAVATAALPGSWLNEKYADYKKNL